MNYGNQNVMDIERIHRYIDGQMEGEELAQFEADMSSDSSLRDELELQRSMINHASEVRSSEDALKALREVHHQNANPDSSPQRSLKMIWIGIAIAAGIALLCYMMYPASLSTPQEIYAAYVSYPTASFGTKGSALEDLLLEAEVAFNQENYEDSYSLFSEYNNQVDPSNGEVEFYKGLSQLALGNHGMAKTIFEELSSSHPLFATDSRWYIGLIELYEGDIDNAKEIFRAFTNGTYAEKAGSILSSLEG